MAKFPIMFSRLVRETAEITVEANTPEEAVAKATELYEEDDNMDWEADEEWGAEDGTHYIMVDGKLIPFSDMD